MTLNSFLQIGILASFFQQLFILPQILLQLKSMQVGSGFAFDFNSSSIRPNAVEASNNENGRHKNTEAIQLS